MLGYTIAAEGVMGCEMLLRAAQVSDTDFVWERASFRLLLIILFVFIIRAA